MYTIKQAAARAGVSVPVMRAWERRYGIVLPARTASGYRLYDESAIERVRAMRTLVGAGWQPSQAAAEIIEHGPEAAAAVAPTGATEVEVGGAAADGAPATAFIEAFTRRFVDAAAALDERAVGGLLDETVARGSFEAVASNLLFPALHALGQAWADGRVSVAGEHMASHAVLRRMAAALEATGHRPEAPGTVLVGLPPGSRHELGALAFSIAVRRAGLPVTYLGADLPLVDWVASAGAAAAVVVGAVTPSDVPAAAAVVRALRDAHPDLLIAIGGRSAAQADGAILLPPDLDEAVQVLQVALAGNA